MNALLLLVAVAIMSSGVRGFSHSMSCSMVNGKTICNEEQGTGNVAGATSQAAFGGGQTFQKTFAGTGDTAHGTFSSSGQQIGQPFGVFGPGPSYGPDPSYGSSSSFSSSSSYGSDQQNEPVPSYGPATPFDPFSFVQAAVPGAFGAAGVGAFAGAGGGFAGVGGFPFGFGRR